jgi:hypothetical protein
MASNLQVDCGCLIFLVGLPPTPVGFVVDEVIAVSLVKPSPSCSSAFHTNEVTIASNPFQEVVFRCPRDWRTSETGKVCQRRRRMALLCRRIKPLSASSQLLSRECRPIVEMMPANSTFVYEVNRLMSRRDVLERWTDAGPKSRCRGSKRCRQRFCRSPNHCSFESARAECGTKGPRRLLPPVGL